MLEQGRAKVDVVGVTGGGFVDLDEMERLMGPDVLAVSVMAANSETRILNPVEEIAKLAHRAGAVFHCDAGELELVCDGGIAAVAEWQVPQPAATEPPTPKPPSSAPPPKHSKPSTTEPECSPTTPLKSPNSTPPKTPRRGAST